MMKAVAGVNQLPSLFFGHYLADIVFIRIFAENKKSKHYGKD